MTFDVFTWEEKHSKAAVIIALAIGGAIFFHKYERKWIAGVMGISAAVIGFM